MAVIVGLGIGAAGEGSDDTEARLFHFREREGREVDLLVETADGRVIDIEIKAATTARSADFKGLTILRNRHDFAGTPFVAGPALNTGSGCHSFGDRLARFPSATCALSCYAAGGRPRQTRYARGELISVRPAWHDCRPWGRRAADRDHLALHRPMPADTFARASVVAQ